jgi:probable phosphoglycerate mutase
MHSNREEHHVTTLLLIRHGANDWVHGRLAGRIPGIHLNDEGRAQAVAVAFKSWRCCC